MPCSRRDVLRWGLTGAAALALDLPAFAAKPTARPNIVFILTDDLGYGDLGSYGSSDTKTPVLDRLAREGARFTQGYSAFPVCSPSRACILTGRYMQRFGTTYEDYFGFGSPGLDPKTTPTLGSLLKKAGYATACFGKWNVNNQERPAIGPNQHGFDKFVGLHLNHNYFTHRLEANNELDFFEDGKPLEREGYTDDILTDEAVDFIKTKHDKPFFMYLAYQTPHTPIQSPSDPSGTPPRKHSPESRPVVAEMIDHLDSLVGKVLDALKQSGQEKQTLVIFTSDNGGPSMGLGNNGPLRGAKLELYEGGIRVPLMVRWPGVVPAGSEFKMPAIAMDLTATIAAAAGISAPKGHEFDGIDLKPFLTGKAKPLSRRTLYWRLRYVNNPKKQNQVRACAVRDGGLEYLRIHDYAGEDGFSEKYVEELYDLSADPGEKNNLALTRPADLPRLRRLFDAWIAATSPS